MLIAINNRIKLNTIVYVTLVLLWLTDISWVFQNWVHLKNDTDTTWYYLVAVHKRVYRLWGNYKTWDLTGEGCVDGGRGQLCFCMNYVSNQDALELVMMMK